MSAGVQRLSRLKFGLFALWHVGFVVTRFMAEARLVQPMLHPLIRIRFAFAFAAGVLLVAAIGCMPPQNKTTTAAPANQPQDPGSEGTAAPRHAVITLALSGTENLFAAINETLGLRVALPVGARRGQLTAVRVEPLKSANSRIAPEFVTTYRILPVTVRRWPGWHVRSVPPAERNTQRGDVLIPIDAPRGALPMALSQHPPSEFWIDITVPKGTAPGDYRGAVVFATGNAEVARLTLNLTVWPIVLPDVDVVPFIADVDHRYLQQPRTGPSRGLTSTLRLLRQHRLTPVLHHLAPEVRTDSRGRLALDWEEYDAIVAPCMSGQTFADRAPAPVWPLPVEPLLVARNASASTPVADAAFRKAYLSLAAEHFADSEWLERAYLRIPTLSESLGEAETTAFMVDARAAHDDLAVLGDFFPQDMTPYGWVGAPKPPRTPPDIWLPPAQFYDPDVMATERAAGRRTWMRSDRPPYSGTSALAASDADVLVLGWQVAALGAEAVHLGCVNNWPDASADPQECLDHDDHTLILPGKAFGLDEPVSTVRLKLLRRTLQDAALARLLTEQGLEHVVQAMRSTLVSDAGSKAYRTSFVDGRRPGWLPAAEAYEQARAIMEGELAARVADAGDDAAQRRRQVTWRQFMLGGRGIEPVVDGVRLRPFGGRDALTAEAEVRITLSNHSRVPIDGTIDWGSLPDGWTGAEEAATVGGLSSGAAQRVALTTSGIFARNSADGVMALPFEFTHAETAPVPASARLAVIIAAAAGKAPRIDGDLSDWPGGTVNVAGDFLLVSRDPAAPAPTANDRPKRRTTAFVLRDDSALYIAINAEADRSAMRDAPRRQRVEYEDLVPIGEELVEILIDPLNSGARTPEGLYHLIIKPSGAAVAEIGLRHDPPCGASRPWPAEIDVATDVSSDRWTAEVRIPLSAFGSVPTQHAFWGFNVTRFDLAAEEYSNWSGAAPNPFDPLCLGNLYLP